MDFISRPTGNLCSDSGERAFVFLTETFAGWLSAKGVLEACSLLNVKPSVNIVKLSWSGQCLPLPLWVVKRRKMKQAVSEKLSYAVCRKALVSSSLICRTAATK